MIDVKTAAQKAMTYLLDLYQGQEISDPMLEEVEHSEDGHFWYVTLSFLRNPTTRGEIFDSLAGKQERDYKVFTVSADTGEVASMKIRKVG